MGKRRRRHQDAPDVQPVDVDGVRTVAILTILWAVAFVILALNRERLDQAGNGWLLWTCLAGVGLGLLGIEYTRKRRDAIAQARLDQEAADEEAQDGPPENAENDATAKPVRTSKAQPRSRRPAGPAGDRQDQTGTRPIPYATDPPPAGATPESPWPEEPDGPPRSTGQLPVTAPGPLRRAPEPPLTPAAPPVTGPVPPVTGPEPPVTGPTRPVTGPLPPVTPEPSYPAPEPPRPARRHRKPSPGPARPGRVDVGGVGDILPGDEPPHHAARSGPTPDEISPTWSELIDTPTTSQPSVSPDPDEPLLDDTTFGGRRAKRYDLSDEISDTTDGGGTDYRGRRARRRPDSA